MSAKWARCEWIIMVVPKKNIQWWLIWFCLATNVTLFDRFHSTKYMFVAKFNIYSITSIKLHEVKNRCKTFPFITEGTTSYTFFSTNKQKCIRHHITCSSSSLVCMIQCNKCNVQYIGETKGLITWAGLARLPGLVSVCRDLGTFVKRNKNQLRDDMTTGPARLAEIPVSRCQDPG